MPTSRSISCEGPVLPVAYEANGYALDVRDRADGSVEVHVETSLNPIGSRGSFSGVRSGELPTVPTDLSSHRDCARNYAPRWTHGRRPPRFSEWVSDHLELIDNDRRPQDAVSVLNRRRRAMFRARQRHRRPADGGGIRGEDRERSADHRCGEAIPHRWVECRLPGAGWVPTDPTLGWWVITPRHVAFCRCRGSGAEDRDRRTRGW